MDSAADYYNFNHPHLACPPGFYVHRLGAFQTPGGGQRKARAARLGILHVPIFDVGMAGGADATAERVAQYLSDPPENHGQQDPNLMKYGCTHATADRDSFVLSLPLDGKCWGCGNLITAEESWEVEIAGFASAPAGSWEASIPGIITRPGDFWKNPEETKKLIQAAKAHIRAAKLVFGDEWRSGIVPPQKGAVDPIGRVITTGWLQHRDIPFWNGRAWAQPPIDNIKAGQHSDICSDFPWDHWFSILAEEINRS